MKNKGFTLIELLAVIVVLAVIAIIATPIVLNTIEEARQGAAQSSAYTYVNEVETKLASYMLKNNGNSYISGKQSVANLKADLGIELKGDAPSGGYVCIGTDGTVKKASIKINNHVVSYDGKNATIAEAEEVENITCDGEVALVGNPILDKAKTLVYDENGVCKTDGTTYTYMGGCYVKGASTNNYIWYNGFMWRIMGINSDNTVRMITDENVTALAYGASNTALTYTENEGYIHDWLNEYFYNHLNITKSIIQNGAYFCSESTNEQMLTEGRTICTSENVVTTKIGIMAIDEYLLAGTSSSYLNIGQHSWTMIPYSNYGVLSVYNDGSVYNHNVANTCGVRPVINVSSTSTVTAGNGTALNFYVLEEDKSISITGKLNEKVTSGEYVSLEGKIYRVVSKESNGVKLILDSFYQEIEGTNYTMQYNETTGDNVFVLTSGIGAKLNGDVLAWLGLNNSDKIIETTYYQGDGFGTGTNYHNTLKASNGVTAKVGLIQVGDIMAGQSSTLITKSYTVASSYNNTNNSWTMNKYTSIAKGLCLSKNGIATNRDVGNKCGVRPVIKVRNDLDINGGNGTWKNPYQI